MYREDLAFALYRAVVRSSPLLGRITPKPEIPDELGCVAIDGWINFLALADELISTISFATFQKRNRDWVLACFGPTVAGDTIERNHRFLEESLETIQSLGCTREEAHQLVDYVFDRPVGDPAQEVGGTLTTLAALCSANGLDMNLCAETELARVWSKIDVIRAKQAAKPKHSPLPESVK